MPNKNLLKGDVLHVFMNKNHEGTPRQARVRRPHLSIPGRYIVEYLDTGEEERNVSYKRCKYASLGNKNSDNWDLISEGSAKHTVVLEGGSVKTDYEKIMKCNDDTCKKFKKKFEELSKPYAAETGDDSIQHIISTKITQALAVKAGQWTLNNIVKVLRDIIAEQSKDNEELQDEELQNFIDEQPTDKDWNSEYKLYLKSRTEGEPEWVPFTEKKK